MPIAWRTIDRDALIHQALTDFVDVVDLVGQMPKIPAIRIGFDVPVVGQLDLRDVVSRRCEKDQGKAAGFDIVAVELFETELLAIEFERSIEIRYTHHRVQISQGNWPPWICLWLAILFNVDV